MAQDRIIDDTPSEVDDQIEQQRYDMVPLPEPPEIVKITRKVEVEPDLFPETVELERAVLDDPYHNMSPDLKLLYIARDSKKQQQAGTKFAEELNPNMMADFVGGPFIDNGNGTYDCTFHHPVYGDVPFTASPDDDVAYGRAAHAFILQQLGR